MVSELARTLALDNKDKDIIKYQFATSEVSAYFKFFLDSFTGSDRGLRIKSRDVSSEPVWDRDNQLWDDNSNTGSYTYWGSGEFTSSQTTIRVVHTNRQYVEHFRDTFFKDTASTTATWTDGSNMISFTSGQIAQSLPIYLNNETVSTATLSVSDGGSVSYYVSANGGSNWESITHSQVLSFTNVGTDLRWKASSSATTSVYSLEVAY